MKMTTPSFMKPGIIILCLSCINCATETTLPQNNKPLANTQWRLTFYADQSGKITNINVADFYKIKFLDTMLIGFDNCNDISATYKVSNGSTLRFGDFTSTLKLCSENIEFLGALSHSNYYEFPQSTLSIVTTLPDLHRLYFVADTGR